MHVSTAVRECVHDWDQACGWRKDEAHVAGELPGRLKLRESGLDMRATLMYAWSRESSCAQGVGLAWLMTPLFGNSSPNPPAPSLSVEPMPITAYPAQRW